jgi:hypothetical protein
MRYVLKRYASVDTYWEPVFVLERITDRVLLSNGMGERALFASIHDAIKYVAHQLPECSVEWEGTTF